MLIGKRIKELRKVKNLSLTELSDKSGVQLATLSRIENLKMVGTVESHINIAKALGVDITQLYQGLANIREGRSSPPQPSKASNEIFSHNDQAYFEILTTNVLTKRMMPVLLKIEPGGKTTPEQNQAGTEKFVFILEGVVEIKAGGNSYSLGKNNTLYFDASLQHHFTNMSKKPAKIICVTTPVAL